MQSCFTSTVQRSYGKDAALVTGRKSTARLGERIYPCSSVRKMAFVSGHSLVQKTPVFSEFPLNVSQLSLLRPVVVLTSGTAWVILTVAREHQPYKEEFKVVESLHSPLYFPGCIISLLSVVCMVDRDGFGGVRDKLVSSFPVSHCNT